MDIDVQAERSGQRAAFAAAAPPAPGDPRGRGRGLPRKGYEATSIQDIADAVGILKGSLYYYITSKEDLLFEILQDVHEQGFRTSSGSRRRSGDALQRIRAFVTLHVTPQRGEPRQDGRLLPRLPLARAPSGARSIVAARDLYDRICAR